MSYIFRFVEIEHLCHNLEEKLAVYYMGLEHREVWVYIDIYGLIVGGN